jgi:hypothetical protein
MTTKPTPAQAIKLLPVLLRRVPQPIREWIYLGLFLAVVVFVVVSLILHGATWDQAYALVIGAVALLAKANAAP